MGKEPYIHIWSSHSLETLKVLKGIHRKGVHLMCFTSDDRCLVSGGLNSSNPLIVHEWRTGEVILSLSSPSPLQDLFCLPDLVNPAQTGFHSESSGEFHEQQGKRNKKQLKKEGIVVVSTEEIILVTLQAVTNVDYLYLKSAQAESTSLAVCALSVIADNQN